MIPKTYQTFFKNLEKNNSTEWFHAHKKEYETNVKAPFIALIEALIPVAEKLTPGIEDDAKKAMFRINRDIRFSKDKSPYNMIMKAVLCPGGRKSGAPGLYIGIDSKMIHVGGGYYDSSPAAITKIRTAIASEPKAFHKLVTTAAFIKHFGELKGERNKRVPKEFAHAYEVTPYIANKQFYAMAEVPLKDFIDSDSILKAIGGYFKAVTPLLAYISKAIA